MTFLGGKREAARRLNRLVAELEQGSEPSTRAVVELSADPDWGSGTTFNDTLEGWRLNGWEDLSPGTTRRYQCLWDVHIRDSIGPRRIATTGPYEIERFLRELKAKGQSRSGVHQARAMLHRARRLVRRWSNNAVPNPVSETELPDWKYGERHLVGEAGIVEGPR